jgi:phosphoribosylaminoimidazole-succinocarboxamide synthase
MSSSKEAITTTDLHSQYKLLATGKVRDLYEIDDSTLLFVATDRVSAFDVVGFVI